ncbi:hypothetical protein CsSME_00003076 [Camellia sinensis var. sinensis]
MDKKHIAQKKISKRKRDEYHVKKENPQANTSNNVDMRHVLRNGEIDLDKCMKYDDIVVHVLQMYKASKNVLYIREKKMNIHDNNIKLIFGVDCGTKPMDISNQRLAL